MSDLIFSILYLIGSAVVVWVIAKDGLGLCLRPVGMVLSACLVAFTGADSARIGIIIAGAAVPRVIEWTAPGAGLTCSIALLLLIIAPDLVAYRKGQRRP